MNEVTVKMKRMLVSLMMVSATAVVSATTYTWDGGGADNNWSSVTNWTTDTAAPLSASNTIVQFDGATRLTPAQDIANPFVLNRLEFIGSAQTSAFTISSNQLQYVANGATQPRIYLARNATCVINNAIDIPAGTTLYAEIGTYGVNLNGVITGGGAIDKSTASGGMDLRSSANSFSGGLTIRANDSDWSKVNIYASGAMGTGPVSLYGGTLGTGFTNPGGLLFFNTTTQTNPISLFANSPIFAGMPNSGDAVTLNSPVDLSSYTLYLRGGGSGTVGGVISRGAASAITKSDAGTWTLNNANTFTGRITLVNGTLKLGAAGSLMPQVGLAFSCATGWYSVVTSTFDLNGRNQSVSQLSGSTTLSFLTNVLTSATAATLVVDQSVATVFNGRLAGALSLVKAGAGSLTLSNCPSATTGNITVSNGTLTVASGASLGSSTNVAVAGGTLELRTAAVIADAASLSIADGAKVWVSGGLTETIDKLFLNGVQQKRGYYGTTASGAMIADDAHFSGAGMVYVNSNPPITPTSVTWDAGGADTFMSSATNWVGDVLPAFDGNTYAVFGTGGATATVDTAVSLYGITFNRDGAFTLAAGAGVISNGAGGITASVPTTTARTYAIAEDVMLTDHQTWNVATNPSVASLNMTGVIDEGFLPCNITKIGFGPLGLTGSNTFDGTLTINEGDVNIYHSQALGSTNGNTVINGSTGGRLVLNGNLTLAEPLVLNGEKNNNGTLIVGSGSNVITGPLSCYSQVRIQGYNGPLVIAGGVTADNNGLFVVNSGSVITFKDKPLNLSARTFWSDSGGISVLAVSGNNWADTICAGGGIRCQVANAMPATAFLGLGVGSYGPGGTFNLNGFNQTVSKLYIGASVPGLRIVMSDTPALLTVNQSVDTIFDGRFTGAVSLLKLGAGNLTLTNAATSTTGSFVVSNGTLTVARDGTFGNNSTNIVVGGTGTLALSNSVTIADSAMLSIANGGTAKVSLASGVNEAVGTLFLGSVQKRAGTYGSTSSAAAIKNDTYFTGTGILTVLHDKSGTLLRVQ